MSAVHAEKTIPSSYPEAVLAILSASAIPLTRAEIWERDKDAFGGDNRKLGTSRVSCALSRLAEDGKVVCEPVRRGETVIKAWFVKDSATGNRQEATPAVGHALLLSERQATVLGILRNAGEPLTYPQIYERAPAGLFGRTLEIAGDQIRDALSRLAQAGLIYGDTVMSPKARHWHCIGAEPAAAPEPAEAQPEEPAETEQPKAESEPEPGTPPELLVAAAYAIVAPAEVGEAMAEALAGCYRDGKVTMVENPGPYTVNIPVELPGGLAGRSVGYFPPTPVDFPAETTEPSTAAMLAGAGVPLADPPTNDGWAEAFHRECLDIDLEAFGDPHAENDATVLPDDLRDALAELGARLVPSRFLVSRPKQKLLFLERLAALPHLPAAARDLLREIAIDYHTLLNH